MLFKFIKIIINLKVNSIKFFFRWGDKPGHLIVVVARLVQPRRILTPPPKEYINLYKHINIYQYIYIYISVYNYINQREGSGCPRPPGKALWPPLFDLIVRQPFTRRT